MKTYSIITLSDLTHRISSVFYKVFRAKNLILLALSTSISINVALADNLFNKKTNLAAEATTDEPTYLNVDEAFTVNVHPNEQGYDLIWTIAPDYYLYKRQFKILRPSLDGNGIAKQAENTATDITAKAIFSKGLKKNDDYFGRVEVFYNQALVVINNETLPQDQPKTLTVKYQGCAEAGLCYPVQTKTIVLPEL